MCDKQNKYPLISIVMPLYNKETHVVTAVSSVLTQTYSNFELIVINDGSTDNGPEFVRKIDDNRIRIYDQKNQGVSVARNVGVKKAHSELIAFLDADDEWFSNYLETIYNLKQKFPSCKVFATSYIYRNPDGVQHMPVLNKFDNEFTEGIFNNYFLVASQSDPPLWTSATCVDKNALLAVDGFPVGVSSGEDLLTWAKLAINYEIAYSNYPRVIYNLRKHLDGDPVRYPQHIDIVGQSLERLMTENDKIHISGFKGYVGLWHQMRATVYIRLNRFQEAKVEVKEMWKYRRLNSTFLVYGMITMMPWPFSITLKYFFSGMKKILRII